MEGIERSVKLKGNIPAKIVFPITGSQRVRVILQNPFQGLKGFPVPVEILENCSSEREWFYRVIKSAEKFLDTYLAYLKESRKGTEIVVL